MTPFIFSPARTVVHRGRCSSTSYGSARLSAALAPQINHPFSLVDALAPIPDDQLVHFNVRRQRTLPVAPFHTSAAALKSP